MAKRDGEGSELSQDGSPTPAPEITAPVSPQTTTHNRYMLIVEILCRHHSVSFAKAAIEKSIPDNYEQMGKHILPRLLEPVALQSQFVKRRLSEIDPIVLPCICFKKDDAPILLVALNSKNKTVTIVDLEQGKFTQEVSAKGFQKEIIRDILLVTPGVDATTSRANEDVFETTRRNEHWLWAPLRQNWSSWFQIILAALGINIFGLALPIFVMNVYDRVIPNLAMVTLWTLAIGVGLALMLDLLLKLIRGNVLELAGRRIDMKIAATLFQHAMDIKLLSRKGGASGIASQIRDFESVRDFFTSSSFIALIDLLFIGIFVFVLWVIVGPIAAVPLLAVPLVMVIALIAQVPIGSSIEKSQQLAAKRHLVLIESLLGIETIKSLNGEPVMQREWENAVAASSRISGKTRFWSNFAMNSTMLIQQGVSVTILLWGVYLVADGRITVGGLIAANILAGRVLAPLGNICQTLVRAQQALKSLSAISSFMALPGDTQQAIPSSLKVRHGMLEFKNVSFTYPGAKVKALDGVNLKIGAGERVGILGRVGSGKTTLGKLVSAMISPDEGLLLVDDHEIQQYNTSVLRQGIGYLPQDPELFTGTIRENLLLGYPNANDDEINQALILAGMDYFIQENPEGLNQHVGEKGSKLSGGQRQAIALARLFLRKPKLLFLDEPTNAMDNVTESDVIQKLAGFRDAHVGLIVSTHRHSLAASMDRLIILDKGRILADGPAKQILAQLTSNQKSSVKKDGS
ncbi:MAG: hypothetical protein COC23_02535 [Hyphomicrobiales bacterium]|nr:type I secretion system permease/ATPase [Ahrensia sp. AH-315-G08]PCH47132.1 MAG: hypothetical protein COC23_02535 [Hyphomicrobiales bacterium]